jgi:hypothetical protein
VSSIVTVKHERVLRILLVFMGVPSVLIGLWAGFAPRGFYDHFPGAGRSWVAPDGPFNEHLVRDVGVLNLALAVVTIAAAVWLTRPLVLATAWAWLAYSVPHLVYHVRHRGALDPSDQVSSLASLALVPVLALAVLVVSARLRPAAPSRSEAHDRVPVMRD